MNIQLIAEIMGTVAFAISGAMLAIERKMDLFGIVFLGIVTAAGGGFIRDMTLGIVPPAMFSSPMVLPLAILSSLAVCALVAWLYKGSDEELHGERFQWILNFTDAIGLGLFTEAGANTAIDSGYGDYHAFVIFLGMLTGVGGGMFRDVLAGIMPAVLRKHVYACASLVGAICYLGLLCAMPRGYAMFTGAMIVVVIRLLASHYKWNIPRVM